MEVISNKLVAYIREVLGPVAQEYIQRSLGGVHCVSTPHLPLSQHMHLTKPKIVPKVLVHFLGELKNIGNSRLQGSRHDIARTQIESLVAFLEKCFKEDYRRFLDGVAHGEVSFDQLWALFKPHCLVMSYCNMTGEPVAMIFRHAKEVICDDGRRVFRAVCHMVINRGNDTLGYVSYTFHIKQFDGNRLITELDVFPLHLHHDFDFLSAVFLNRGRAYMDLFLGKIKVAEYHDVATLRDVDTGHNPLVEVAGRIVVDPVACKQITGTQIVHPFRNVDNIAYDNIDPGNMTDNQLFACHNVVYGWVFKEKKWGELKNLFF
jgi:hypothetical protein